MTRIFHWFFMWKMDPISGLCLHYRPETIHCSTKDVYTSEKTFLALHPWVEGEIVHLAYCTVTVLSLYCTVTVLSLYCTVTVLSLYCPDFPYAICTCIVQLTLSGFFTPPRPCTTPFKLCVLSGFDFNFPIISGMNKLYQIKGFLYHLSDFTFLNLYPKGCTMYIINWDFLNSL